MPRRSLGRGAEWRTQEVHSGANDLALFGVVPVAFVLVPALAEARGIHHVTAAASLSGSSLRDAGSPDPHAAHITALDLPHVGSVPLVVGHNAPVGGVSTLSASAPRPAITDHNHVATFVPAPHGSGSLAVPQQEPHSGAPVASVATPIADESLAHFVSAPAQLAAVDEAMASIRASAGALQGALATLAERVQGVSVPGQDTVHDALAQVHQTVAGIVGQMPDVHQILADTTAHTTAIVGELTSHATATVASTVGDVVSHVAPLVDHATAGITDTIGAATAGATHTVGTIASDTTGSLHDVLGSDPHAGIATLVGMVSAADAFDLHDDTAHATGLTPALGALGATDLLADVHPAAVLPGLLDSHAHDLGHHDGLFGHG